MWHIVDRFIIHLFAAPGVVLSLAFVLNVIQKKTNATWLPTKQFMTIMLAALVVLPIAFVREPFDVNAGQSLVKTAFDFISWSIGCLITPWMSLALKKWL